MVEGRARPLKPPMASDRHQATPAVAAARALAARVRVALAAVGALLLLATPDLHPAPVAAAAGLAILALTGLVHGTRLPDRVLVFEEALATGAGVLIVTCGDGRVTVLTLLWLVSAAVGVIARGGRVDPAGQVLVVAVLASPLLRFGLTPETIGLLATGCGLLLVVVRLSAETAELLRDPLTGVLSRAALEAQADRMPTASVVLLDLDDFGMVNKQRGHAAGDELLAAAADAMVGALRSQDVLGRLGGDEFAVLVPSGDGGTVADRLVAALAAVGVGASAGVAGGLGAADVALRTSKREGKGRTTIYDGPAAGAEAALARLCAGEDIAIHLQPIVDLDTGATHAYEALARFAVRDGGEHPLPWFALADRLGRRPELERACLRASLARLIDVPTGCLLCVNLSADVVVDDEVLSMIEGAAATDRLVVEVAERETVVADTRMLAAVIRLRANRVRIAVNDVGVGHAGLSQLAAARPEYLKLDRRIVRGIADDADRTRFMRSFAAFVRDTGCQVIAEGIESPEDLEAVRSSGIEFAQGFLLGRPVASVAPDTHQLTLVA